MSTFVLVHGGYSGGWIWRETARRMVARGHDVFTPTLTGMGERVHLVNRETGLETFVQDIVNVLQYEDLHGVILVGFSFSGMVITGVGGRAAERLSHLVYLDAYLPKAGQSASSMFTTDFLAYSLRRANAFDGYRTPPPVGSPARYTPMPVKASVDRLIIHDPAALQALLHTFIYCTADKADPSPTCRPVVQAAERVRNDPNWVYIETPHGHELITEDPELTAELLIQAAAREPTSRN